MRRALFVYSMQKTRKDTRTWKEGLRMNVLYEQGLESVAGELSQMGFSMHPLRAAVRADAVL